MFFKRSGLLHWLPAAKWRTCNSFLGLNFRTRLHSTLRKKGEKRKCWGRLVDRLQAVPLQSVESKLGRTGESEMAEGELPLGFLFFTFTCLAPFPRSHDHPGDWSQSNLWKVYSFSKNSNWIDIWFLLNRGWIRIFDCSFYNWIIESKNKIILPLMNSLVR